MMDLRTSFHNRLASTKTLKISWEADMFSLDDNFLERGGGVLEKYTRQQQFVYPFEIFSK